MSTVRAPRRQSPATVRWQARQRRRCPLLSVPSSSLPPSSHVRDPTPLRCCQRPPGAVMLALRSASPTLSACSRPSVLTLTSSVVCARMSCPFRVFWITSPPLSAPLNTLPWPICTSWVCASRDSASASAGVMLATSGMSTRRYETSSPFTQATRSIPNDTSRPEGSWKPPRRSSSSAGSTGTQSVPGIARACADARSDQPTPALASSASSSRRRTIVLMPVTMSDVPRTAFRHDDRLQALPAHAGFQRRLRRNPPVARLVEIGQFAPVVHDEQHVVVPQPPEVAACARARTARRVAHQHAPAAQHLAHHEMAAAALVDQPDRRQAILDELVSRQHTSVGLVPWRLPIAPTVQQRAYILAAPLTHPAC